MFEIVNVLTKCETNLSRFSSASLDGKSLLSMLCNMDKREDFGRCGADIVDFTR